MINVKLHTKEGDDEFEKMRLFCALRHFPELRTSLAVAGKVDIPEPQSRIKSTYEKPKGNESFKLGFSNRNAHKVLKNLSTSVLAEVDDPYGPVRSHLRHRREVHRQSQMSHKQEYNELSRPGSSSRKKQQASPVETVLHEDPLRRVCQKLAQAGISLGQSNIQIAEYSNEDLKREVSTSGLLAVLGMPAHLSSAPNTPRFSPRASVINSSTNLNTASNRGTSSYIVQMSGYNSNSYIEHEERDGEGGLFNVLKQRMEVILCIKVDPEEQLVLYEALYTNQLGDCRI